MRVPYLVVGAGYAGSTIAERIASQLGKKVLVVEQRNHVGGNAYDCFNDDGILIQKYGPHIFHTQSREVWTYLSKFTEWNGYVHRVLASVRGMEVYLPINIDTMERLYGRSFTPEEMAAFLEEKRIKLPSIQNSRDVVVSQVGEELYELFFRNYTKKSWGVFPEELDAQVTKRLPVRLSRDTRYFEDSFQGIPRHGYTRMFQKMLDHPNIHLMLNTNYREVIDQIDFDRLIFTGPVDQFFDHVHGKLPYRSLDLRFDTLDTRQHQNAAVVNYPNEHDYTRVTESKQFYFQQHEKTTICYEYPKAEGDPYYPIPAPECQAQYLRYKLEADKYETVHFIGRLAEYRYLNMDQVVANALELARKI
jgi:UDP-galactopyranose mutase